MTWLIFFFFFIYNCVLVACINGRFFQKVSVLVFQLTIMAHSFFENISNLTQDERNRLCKQFEKYIHKIGDCHVWQGRMDAHGYGEIRLQFRGSRVSLKAHRVVFAISQPDVYLQSPNNDVSHLCFNRNCVKIKHLSLEPHSINNKRLICKNDGECYGHYGFSDCLV